MKNSMIRLVSWLLVIAMMAAMPLTAFAAGEHEHTFKETVKSAPTCADKGFTKLKCIECGYITYEDYTPARHNFDEGVEKEDYTKYTCLDCGYSFKSAHHTHAYSEIHYPATCVSNGYTQYRCTACDDFYFDYDTDLATGHDWGEWSVSKAASTSAEGLEVRVCKTCGEKDTRPTDKLDPTNKIAQVVNGEFVFVREDAAADAAIVGVALKGSRFSYESRFADGKWIGIGEDMWINRDNLTINPTGYLTSAYAGAKYYGAVKTGVQLKVRTGPSELSALVSSLSSGSEFAIYSITKDDADTQWGRISKTEEKWVELTNVEVYKIITGTLPDGNAASFTPPKETSSTTSTTVSADKVIASGVVNSNSNLNVRKEAQITVLNLLGSLPNGTKVDIYQTKNVNGHTWGRIDFKGSKGWICMDYVNITSGSTSGSDSSSSGSSSTTAAAAPNATVVNCSTGVNVRKSASVTSTLKSVIPVNSRIAVTKLDDGWGYVDGKGWVYLAYVKLDAGAEEAIKKGNTTTNSTAASPAETPIPTHTDVAVPAEVTATTYVYSKTSTNPTASKIVLTLEPVEDVVTVISGRTIVNGQEWGKVTVGGITGWILMDNGTVDLLEVTGTVSADTANVYEDKNVDGEVITVLGKGTKVTVEADGQYTDGTYIWGKVKGVEGYIQMHNLNLTYRTDSAANNSGVKAVSITGKTNSDGVSLMKTPDSTDAMITLGKGTAVTITDWKSVSGVAWGKTSFGNYTGWIRMTDIDQNSINGTVTAETVNLYHDYTSSTVELVLRKGEKVVVLERMLYGSAIWGRIKANGINYWGNLQGVTLEGQEVETPTTAPSAPAAGTNTTTPPASTTAVGSVVNTEVLNVRSAAGTRNAKVAELKKGTKVNVYEQTTVDDAQWGRIDQGWVAMMYIDLSAKTNTTGTTTVGSTDILTTVPTGAVAVGFVNTADLAVRAGAGQGYNKVGTLKKGANVTILEQQLKDGMIWGRIDSGWICTSYVTLTGLSVTGAGTAGTVKGVFYTANIRSIPGVSGALVGKVMVNSRLEILEEQMYSGQAWGRTSIGWILMDYVLTGNVPVV